MSKEKRRVPKLRFPGFTEDWEQRKLGDVADVRDGTHDSPKFYNDGFPLVTSKNLKDGSIDFSDCSFISKQDFDEINKRSKVDSGDILFGMIGTIGNPAIVEHTGFAIKNVALIKEGIIVNNRFIYHLLSSKVFDNYIARENAGGTQKFIALNQIRNFIFLAPTLEEQNKIIELLDYISQTITLHQRKLNNLKLKKKALLQKLFPKNGERYPELRFSGFTDAWEQRKLSEVVTINPKTELPDKFKYVDLESVVGTNLLGFQVIKKENAPSRAQRLASYGDVFYQTVRPYQRNNYLFENIDKDMVFSTGYAQLRSKLDSYFLLTLVQNDNFVKVVLDNCTGTSYPAINGSELGKITVQIPSNGAEANQIGKVFRGIDNIITLHQRKLDHLQLQKKALLQQMFV